MVILVAFLACTQELRLQPPTGGGGVIQLDGTPEKEETVAPVQGDPESPDVTTRGVRFPLAFLQGPSPGSNGPAAFELWIESEGTTQAEIVGPQSGFALQVSLTPGVNVVPLPDPQLEPISSGFVFGVGLELLTDAPVHAVGVHHRVGHTESTRLLPWRELGVNYVVAAVSDDSESGPSSFVVVATEDETDVIISPSAATLDFRPPGVAIPLTMQAGEVVQYQADGDLTGSRVFATKKVAVFSGGQEPVVDCEGPNHVWEQLPPLTRWATDWLIAPWPDQPYQYALVVSATSGTVVTLDCEPVASLGAGQSVRLRLDDPGRIRSNQPVLVTQLAVGGACERGDDEPALGDPNLLLATRAALTRDGAVSLRPAEHPTLALGPGGRFDRAVFFRRSGDVAISLTPSPAGVDLATADDRSVEFYELSATTTAQGDGLQGHLHGVTEGNAYAHDIGVDCEGCGPALAVPAICD